jgi:hypothetical protein
VTKRGEGVRPERRGAGDTYGRRHGQDSVRRAQGHGHAPGAGSQVPLSACILGRRGSWRGPAWRDPDAEAVGVTRGAEGAGAGQTATHVRSRSTALVYVWTPVNVRLTTVFSKNLTRSAL